MFCSYGTSVKIKSKMRDALKEDDIEKILKMKSVRDIITYLKKNTSYYKNLKNIDENLIRRGQFEVLIKKTFFNDTKSLKIFENTAVKKFLKILIIKNEIENLKLHFRLIRSGSDCDLKNIYTTEMYGYESLNFFKFENYMDKKISFNDFIESMNGTIYYKLLFTFLNEKNENQSLFRIDAVLDNFYMKMIFSQIKKIHLKKHREVLRKIFGIKVDAANIMHILRARFFYNLHTDEIYPHILPFYYKIRPSNITSLIETKSYSEACGILEKTVYRKIFLKEASFLEKNFKTFNVKMIKKIFRKYSYSVISPIIYLEMKNYEINNIITIVEGVRYGMNPEEIKKHIN